MFGKSHFRINPTLTSMARFFIFVLIINAGQAINSSVRADVSLEPTRVILTSAQRVETILIQNTGSKKQKVTPVWTMLVQGADANLYPTNQEIPLSQFTTIKVWPTETIIAPGSSARFSILLDPTFRPEGEARHHLRFNIDPEHGNGPRWAVVIPVFTRGPSVSPQVKIMDVSSPEPGIMTVSMQNSRGASPHGHLVLFDQQGQRITALYNINIYDTGHVVTFKLDIPPGSNPARFIRYLGDAEFQNTLFAEKEIGINSDPNR